MVEKNSQERDDRVYRAYNRVKKINAWKTFISLEDAEYMSHYGLNHISLVRASVPADHNFISDRL